MPLFTTNTSVRGDNPRFFNQPMLRDYQQQFVDNTIRQLAKTGNTIAQLGTGGGKTRCFTAICKRYLDKFPDKAVLILVHREELLKQSADTLFNVANISANLIRSGINNIPYAKVHIAMVETMNRRMKILPRNVGLVIVDEAHINLFKKVFDALPPDTWRIGFTATPISASKDKPLKDSYDAIVCGPQVHELIAMGYLCQNITYAPKDTIERASLVTKGSDFNDRFMGDMMSKPKYINNTVEAYRRHALGTKTIIFNCNVDHSKKVTEAFTQAGFNARHFDATCSAHERHATLKWFKDSPDAILCNVALATTGFDEPTIETVIVNKATKSVALWFQMTGRGSRPTPNKKYFTIIDMGGNATEHGDWSAPKDWEAEFLYPKRKKKGDFVAPQRDCPKCQRILPISVRICPECGHEFVTPEEVAREGEYMEMLQVTANIDIETLIEQNRMHKEYYSFFCIPKKVAQAGKQKFTRMDLPRFNYLLEEANRLSQEWCRLMPKKRFDAFHKARVLDTLKTELISLFGPEFLDELPPEISAIPQKYVPPQTTQHQGLTPPPSFNPARRAAIL